MYYTNLFQESQQEIKLPDGIFNGTVRYGLYELINFILKINALI